MALINELDEAGTQTRLSAWLEGRLEDAQDIRVSDVVIPQSAGMSMTTILFKASWRQDAEDRELDLVARVAPPKPGIFEDTDLEREFALMRALQDTRVKVPTARWVENDPDVLGGQFVVVDRAYGEVPSDDPPYTTGGWVLEVDPARRGKLYEEALDVLDELQRIDWRAKNLDALLAKPEFGALGIDEQIARWEAYYHWARGEEISSPTIEAALEWVKDNKPSGEDLVVGWGDARSGNIIYDRDTLDAQAVLDWELATIASPEQDLAWLVLFPRFYSEGIGAPVPEGMQSREELIARWEELTGRTATHVDYYEAFGALRLSMMMVRAGSLMIAAGALPPDNPMPVNNPPANILANLLGLPAPAGDSDFFVGKR